MTSDHSVAGSIPAGCKRYDARRVTELGIGQQIALLTQAPAGVTAALDIVPRFAKARQNQSSRAWLRSGH
jgi:hypothetical protein